MCLLDLRSDAVAQTHVRLASASKSPSLECADNKRAACGMTGPTTRVGVVANAPLCAERAKFLRISANVARFPLATICASSQIHQHANRHDQHGPALRDADVH